MIDKMIFDEPSEAMVAEAHAYAESAQRAAGHLPDLEPDTPTRAIDSAAVIGAGTMGGGIAMAFAAAGIPVTLIDTSEEALDRGLERIRKNYEVSLSRGRLTEAEMEARIGLIARSASLSAVAGVDIIIEAVFEDLDLKRSLFKDIDALAKPGAILATNTSALDINLIAEVTRRPADVVGAHFFSPANVMRLLEVIRADKTSAEVVASVLAMGSRLGKTGVQSLVYPGFIGNAMFRHYLREANFLVEEGADPAEVDSALTGFGFAMGPFAVLDLTGLDVGIQQRRKALATRPADRRYPDLGMALCDLGRLGQKTGRGWYRYEEGSRTPVPDPELRPIIAKYADERGIAQREIGRDEILERCLFSIVNEGARLVELGVALRPSDVDVVQLLGYGFPKKRGGPLYFADQVGLSNMLSRVEHYHRTVGADWAPSELLVRLAADNGHFADLNQAASMVTA